MQGRNKLGKSLAGHTQSNSIAAVVDKIIDKTDNLKVNINGAIRPVSKQTIKFGHKPGNKVGLTA